MYVYTEALGEPQAHGTKYYCNTEVKHPGPVASENVAKFLPFWEIILDFMPYFEHKIVRSRTGGLSSH